MAVGEPSGGWRRYWPAVAVAVIALGLTGAEVENVAHPAPLPTAASPPRTAPFLFDASATNVASTADGSYTNITLGTVNASVLLAHVQLWISPRDYVLPNTTWRVLLLENFHLAAVYRMASTADWTFSTAAAGFLADGEVFSIWIPNGAVLSGGTVSFWSSSATSATVVTIP